jgi:catechol 2,3-dioxygenase-like lactoylglutathione lyase family enzyme
MRQLSLIKNNHINAIVDGYHDSVEHFQRVFGMQLNMPIPARGDDTTDACLMSLGGEIFEFFAPQARGDKGQARLLDLYDDHYIGIEFQVPNVSEAREICNERGIRIINDPGAFFFTHGGACHGISYELWDGDWHTQLGRVGTTLPVAPLEYWRDEHPLALTGMARMSVAVNDIDAAINTFVDLFGVRITERGERPQAGAIGAELQLGDVVVDLLAPT